jgi:hypothetical protein
VAKKILEMLARDSNREQNFRINLNFTKPTARSKKHSTSNHPYRPGWKLEVYHDLWLNISGTFLDNTKFQLTILDINQVSSGWKRSRSGKRKYKTKTKFNNFEVAITLKYPFKKYGAVKAIKLADAQAAIKLPNWATCKKINISDRAIFLRVKVDSKRSLEDVSQVVTMMFLSLYQILNLAKILSKNHHSHKSNLKIRH